jgi:hypothetical protein
MQQRSIGRIRDFGHAISSASDERFQYFVPTARVIASATLRSSAAGPISTHPMIGFAGEEPCLAAEVLDRRR